MCGIAGSAGAVQPELLGQLRRALCHRGPDASGVYEDRAAGVGLVSARLAVLDLDGGTQPMEGEQASIVFNGEIYNAPALRERLERDGVRFATDHSDTEVVLRLYEHVGERCVEELNGMFAFVIHDRARGMLFGARDRFGIKPLYLARP